MYNFANQLNNMKLPTKTEINLHNSLDEQNACSHFYNKTLEQAEVMFRKNSLYYQEDLMWMGVRAFSFYLQAVNSFLQSTYSTGEDHFIDALHGTIKFRMKEKEFYLAIDDVKILIAYVIDNYEKFEVEQGIYGDLLEAYNVLQRQIYEMN